MLTHLYVHLVKESGDSVNERLVKKNEEFHDASKDKARKKPSRECLTPVDNVKSYH